MAKIVCRLTVLASLICGVAYGEGKLDEAKTHLASGASLYDENNFRGALVEFQKAYELAPSYKILFNIAQVEMELQDYAGALKAYARYMKEGGPDVPVDRATQINAELERLRGRVGFLVVQTAPGAQVLVDDVQVGYAPLAEPVPVAAGQHRVTVTASGRDPINRVFDVAGKETVTAALAIEAPVGVAPRPITPLVATAPALGPKSKTPAYAMWGVTGAFAIGAGMFAAVAHADSNDLTALRNTYPVTADQLASLRSKTVRAAAITDVLGGTAVVSAALAIYLTVTRRDKPREQALTLEVAPTGVGVMGRF